MEGSGLLEGLSTWLYVIMKSQWWWYDDDYNDDDDDDDDEGVRILQMLGYR